MSSPERGETELTPAGHGDGDHSELVPASSGHRHERPEDWGWHADLGGMARIGGVVTAISLALMITATHYNHAGTLALVLCLAAVLGGLLWDFQRRRTSWRQ
jgi:hypothetical protein